MALAVAFLRRDWLKLTSYRLAFLGQLFGVLAFVGIIFVVGNVVGDAAKLQGGGSSYASFVLAGVMFTDVFLTSMKAFPDSIKEAQVSGTLEPMLVAPIRVSHFVLASSSFALLQSLFRICIALLVAVTIFRYWHHANPLTLLLVLVPGCLAFAAAGLFSAAFVVMFKQGDPVIGGYAFVSSILGGSIFPITILPGWLRPVGLFLPLTHALGGVRIALEGGGPMAAAPQIAVLWLMTLLLIPLALATFRWSLRRAKKEGSLVHY